MGVVKGEEDMEEDDDRLRLFLRRWGRVVVVVVVVATAVVVVPLAVAPGLLALGFALPVAPDKVKLLLLKPPATLVPRL